MSGMTCVAVRPALGWESIARMTISNPSGSKVPRAPLLGPSSTSTRPMPPSAPSTHHAAADRRRPTRPSGSSPEPLHDVLDVHLVVLVVAGQRVHDDVDTHAIGHLALGFATLHRHDAMAALV